MPIDAKKYLAEKASELGLTPEEIAIGEKILTSNQFKGDFVPLPDFHSTLDRQKNQYQQELSKVVQMNREWQEAYDTQYAPALSSLERLKQSGFDVSKFSISDDGDLTTRGGNVITEDQIDAMIAAKVDPIRETAIGWGTFVADKSVEYRDTFGKRFDAEKFRKFGYENRDKYPTFESAYDAFTLEDRKVKEEKDLEKWKNDEREKLRLELMSTANFPEPGGVEGTPPAFLADEQKEEVTRDANRQAFASQFHNLKISI